MLLGIWPYFHIYSTIQMNNLTKNTLAKLNNPPSLLQNRLQTEKRFAFFSHWYMIAYAQQETIVFRLVFIRLSVDK